jgi:VWFA-related protein
MCRLWTSFAIAGISLLLSPVPRAQTAQGTSIRFTSSTELVLVPTVVNDKSGVHVPGLKKEEFSLKQDGKSQPIAVFEEVQTTSTRLQRSAGEKGTFSNFEPGGSGEYHRLNVIVLDFVNTPFADLANARKELVKFLSEVAESGEPMCLLALTRGGLTLLHDFTDDPKLLAAALSKVKGNNATLIHEPLVDTNHPTGGGLAAVLTMLIRNELQNETLLATTENKVSASLTVQALQQIAKAFRDLPGRKSLIWASSGFAFSLNPGTAALCEPACTGAGQKEMQASYESLWRMMNDAQMAIYSVDLRSTGSSTFMANGGVRPSDMGDPQFDTDAQAQYKVLDTDSTLVLFAENTGGKAFLGGGNLVKSFQQATMDDSRYYMLGYYVSRNNAKPGWHQISVSINRRGAHARYRNSFLLSRDSSAPTARQDMQLALASPLDFVGMQMSVTWSGTEPGKSGGKTKVKFDLVLPANFASVDESDQNHMVVDIAAVARNLEGNVVADFSQRVEAYLKHDGLEQIQQNGMTYRNGIQLPPGEYRVRFVVRDSLSNRMGSVVAPIKVAP